MKKKPDRPFGALFARNSRQTHSVDFHDWLVPL
jgi:hypothetical protein